MLEGLLPFTKRETDMSALKQPRNTRISIITGNPDEVRAASCVALLLHDRRCCCSVRPPSVC